MLHHQIKENKRFQAFCDLKWMVNFNRNFAAKRGIPKITVRHARAHLIELYGKD